MRVGVNKFVLRQTEQSRFTSFNGSWETICRLVEAYFDQAKAGYRDGVMLVPVPADGFSMKGPMTVHSVLDAKFAPRAEGEAPVLQITNHDEKIPCKFVDIVIYRADVLAEDNDRSTDADWEIVSINGKQEDTDQPIPPMTMARNFLHLKGGTKADYTAQQFAESIVYWNSHL